jgi:hypothetical protein
METRLSLSCEAVEVRWVVVWLCVCGVLVVVASDAAALTSTRLVSRAAFEADLPTLAATGNGRVAVAWVQQRAQNTGSTVWLAVGDSKGRFGRAQVLSSSSTTPDPGFASTPGLVVDVTRRGRATVVWSTEVSGASSRASGFDDLLVYRQRAPNGRLSPVRVLDREHLGNPEAFMTPLTGGRALLVYERVPLTGNGFDGGLSTVFARVMQRDGRFSSPHRLSGAGVLREADNPLGVGAVTDRRGRTLVVWAWSTRSKAGNGAVLSLEYRIRSPGGTWSPPRRVPGTVNIAYDYPGLFPLQSDSRGDVLIAWNPTPNSAPSRPVRAVWLDGITRRFRPLRGLPPVDATFQAPAFALADGRVMMTWLRTTPRSATVDAATGALTAGTADAGPIWGPIAQPVCATQPFCSVAPMTPAGPVNLVSTGRQTTIATWYAITSYTVNTRRQIAHSRTVRLIARIADRGRWTRTILLRNTPAPLYAGSDQLRSDLVSDGSTGAWDAFLIGTPRGLNRVAITHIEP